MSLPYGIEEQYEFIEEFLNKPSGSDVLHLRESYYETPSILTIAIQAWEVKHGSKHVSIRYLESDSAIKRILINKKTGERKTIVLDIPYTLGWNLIHYKKQQFVAACRQGS